MKRAQQAKHDDVESELFMWFCSMRGNNVPLNGPPIKSKAIAKNLRKTDWKSMMGGFPPSKQDATSSSKTFVVKANALISGRNQY
ncbi:hypothetical protein RRG08_014762 [Elysia crispata]|uniref:Uncharacterized protein n=1 Tax=Elysia crispata TaxID=231223 RepID=A0AAE0ZTN7_9GAST|nr:hypothetical protein RRG08_014762 [Elysia crispata]